MTAAGWTRERLLAAPPPTFAWRSTVPFHHVDAAGIVFYARVLEWFHAAYCAWLDQGGHSLATALREGRWLAPVVHAEADYLSPLRFGDPIAVEMVGVDLSDSRAALGYRVVTTGGRVAAVGSMVHVFVDADVTARAPIPPDVAAWFRTLGGPP